MKPFAQLKLLGFGTICTYALIVGLLRELIQEWVKVLL